MIEKKQNDGTLEWRADILMIFQRVCTPRTPRIHSRLQTNARTPRLSLHRLLATRDGCKWWLVWTSAHLIGVLFTAYINRLLSTCHQYYFPSTLIKKIVWQSHDLLSWVSLLVNDYTTLLEILASIAPYSLYRGFPAGQSMGVHLAERAVVSHAASLV